MTGRLSGRVAVITGAARGIGAATAERFAAEGAAVCLGDRDAGPLSAVLDQIRAVGGAARGVPGDCADPAVAARLAACALDAFGALDIVVNNAGSTRDAVYHGLDPADWNQVLNDGLTTTAAVIRACLPSMRQRATEELVRDGRVAHQRKITSTVAAATFTGSPGQSALSATGGAVLALTRTLARELGGYGINVNAIVPGFVETRFTAPQTADHPDTGIPEPVRQLTLAMTALGRYGAPADLAGVHLFLASEDADFVTGAALPVTGGLLGTLH
jgi:3-oxoacyl-[acyl-carrier protein] reductase